MNSYTPEIRTQYVKGLASLFAAGKDYDTDVLRTILHKNFGVTTFIDEATSIICEARALAAPEPETEPVNDTTEEVQTATEPSTVAPAEDVAAPETAAEDVWAELQAEEEARTAAAAMLAGKSAIVEPVEQQPVVQQPVAADCITTSPLGHPRSSAVIIQPDANGEFPTPADGALWMASLGIPQIPLRGKAPFMTAWMNSATTDPAQIRAWAAQYPGGNFGSVAKAGKCFVFEADSPEVSARFLAATGQKFTSQLIIQSRPGRGHRWYLHADGVVNISQLNKHGDFSLRVDNEQCVSPGSIHPETGKQYRVAVAGALTPPTQQEIDFWNNERIEKSAKTGKEEFPRDADGYIIRGNYHGYMLREAGKLRAMGLGEEEIYPALSALVHKNCAPPIDESRVKAMAKSICNFEEGAPTIPLEMSETSKKGAAPAAAQGDGSWLLDTSETATRPEFPLWVAKGTSLYENLVKPAVETSSKYPELIFVPAVQVMLNHLSMQIEIGNNPAIFNMFVGLISEPGEFFKSSCCELGHQLFTKMGVLVSSNRDMKTAEGKTVIGSMGSSEGFGLQMQRVNGNRAILFNDELGKLVNKVGIENSTFSQDLLSWYESRDFSNGTSDVKKFFHFNPQKYVFGWQWCTTTRGFNRHWPKLAGVVSGLEDRMFFVVAPKKPRPTCPFYDPPLESASAAVKKVIDKAIKQKNYEFWDFAKYAEMVSGMLARSMALVQSLALYFAVDLGRSVIDEDCVKRAIAMVKYREQTARFLEPIEADNQQGRLQKEMVRELRQHGGKMPYRQFCLNLDYSRYGAEVWSRAYSTMLPSKFDPDGIIREWPEETTKGKRKTRMVGLVLHED